MMEDKLDVQRVLAKYSNPAGEIGSQDLMMFMKRDLNFNEIEYTRTNEYIRYVSGDSRATKVNTIDFLETLKRLNPQFADYIDRGPTHSGTIPSKQGTGYGITIQPAETNKPSGSGPVGSAIVPPSR